MLSVFVIVGAVIIGVVAMVLKSKSGERLQKERMFHIERGTDVPKELYPTRKVKEKTEDLRKMRVSLLLVGVLMVFIGTGVMIGVSIQDGIRAGMGGVIALLIGVGFIVAERVIVKAVLKPNGEMNGTG